MPIAIKDELHTDQHNACPIKEMLHDTQFRNLVDTVSHILAIKLCTLLAIFYQYIERFHYITSIKYK